MGSGVVFADMHQVLVLQAIFVMGGVREFLPGGRVACLLLQVCGEGWLWMGVASFVLRSPLVGCLVGQVLVGMEVFGFGMRRGRFS